MYHLQDETGDVPNYGSNDGALIFPVTACNYRDYKPVINTIYVITQGERLYEHGNHDEEILWFTNETPDKLPLSGICKKPVGYKESGLYSFSTMVDFLCWF